MAAAVPPPRPGRVRHALSEFFMLVSCWFDGTRSPYTELDVVKDALHDQVGAYDCAIGDIAAAMVEAEEARVQRDHAAERWEDALAELVAVRRELESARRWAVVCESETASLREQLAQRDAA